jgi:regulator of protease activity HflC (stomatin/prohibitin superfamily)
MAAAIIGIVVVLGLLGLLLASSIKIVREYERSIVFRRRRRSSPRTTCRSG